MGREILFLQKPVSRRVVKRLRFRDSPRAVSVTRAIYLVWQEQSTTTGLRFSYFPTIPFSRFSGDQREAEFMKLHLVENFNHINTRLVERLVDI
jgi:hypothetical protein